MFSELVDNEQLVALRNAYAKACTELGLSPDEGDKDRASTWLWLCSHSPKGAKPIPR
jgi:hypothetical protein